MRAIIATNVTYTPGMAGISLDHACCSLHHMALHYLAHLRTLAALSIASIDIFSTIIKGVYMDAHLVTEEHTGDISTNIALLCMPAVRRLMMELLVMINVLKVQVKRNLADSSKVNEAARNDILYVQVALARPRLRLDVLLKIVLDVGATMRSKVDIFPAAGVLEEKGSEQMRTCDPRIILLTLHHIHLLLGGSLPTAEDDMTLAQYWEMASRGRTRAPSIKHLISLSAQWHDLARQHILPTVISGFFGSGVPLEYQTVIEQRHQLKSGSIMQRTGLFMAPGVGTLGGLYDMARPAVDDVYMDVDDGDAAAWFEQSRLWLQTHEWFDVGTEEYGIIAETMPAYQCERCFGVSKVTSIIGETSGCICGGAWRAIVQ